MGVWDPELNLRAGAGFTHDATPTSSELGPLLHRSEPDMTREVKRFGDNKSGSVIGDGHAHTAVAHLG